MRWRPRFFSALAASESKLGTAFRVQTQVGAEGGGKKNHGVIKTLCKILLNIVTLNLKVIYFLKH